MKAMLRSWWQQIKKQRVSIGVVGIVLVVVIALIIAGYWFDWTGFNGYTQVTTAHTLSGPNAGTVTRTEVYQPGKALWDWLQLLIIPAVLAAGGYLFTYTTSRNEQKATQLRDQTERDVALDNQREAALQGYLDNMSELLLEKKLRESGENDEVQTLARVRTLTVLPRLDGRRKASVVQFLYESGLIHKDKKIVDLKGADLMEAYVVGATLVGADLRGANLYRATLAFTNLRGANLSGDYMEGANLSFTNLRGANLSIALMERAWLKSADLSGTNMGGANLSGADLGGAKVTTEQLDQASSLKGATMPDGTKHA